MQLSPSTGSVDAALAELKVILPVAALTNIVARRRKRHQDVKYHQRILAVWKARQIMMEAAVD
jgi:hypothetical protein